jgi:hypothetical protein
MVMCYLCKFYPVCNIFRCTINCQLFEFMNQHTHGNAVKPYVETMIADQYFVYIQDIKEVIGICMSKKDRQHNGQMKKKNDLQNIHIKLNIE